MKEMKPRSASEVADALECYRMKSERQRENCKNKSCHYNNNDPHYGCWCCSNSILHDAVSLLKEQEAKAPSIMQDAEGIWATCPTCGNKLRAILAMEMNTYFPKYCQECGQAVKLK